jgi:phosphoribosylanthranilate isomerase
MDASGVTMAQLHGNEDAAFCAELGAEIVIKVVRPGPDFEASGVMRYPAAAILIDACDEKLKGGTGRTANWEIAWQVAQLRPLFLAGGLGPGNVREAMIKAAPFAVDVNSGVESAPGRKDREKLRQLRVEMDR